jgi:hypothetical protein
VAVPNGEGPEIDHPGRLPSEPGPADHLGEDAKALYAEVPDDGTPLSNKAVRVALGWESEATDDRYFSTRDLLEDAGLVVRGRGRGGTVRRVLDEAQSESEQVAAEVDTPDEVADSLRREHDLYEPLQRVIKSEWARVNRSRPLAVEITAHQGRRATGIWARPDIVSVEIRAFDHVPGKFLEVRTFEVKPSDGINVQAVYEALAHRRAATHSYVLLHVPADKKGDLETAVAELCEVARGHGIGVITVESPDDYDTWEEREVAGREEPDPEYLDAFLGSQLSETAQREIRLALR